MPTLPRALGAIAVLLLSASACSGSVSLGGPGEIEQEALEADILSNITGEDSEQVEVTCEGPLAAVVDATVVCFAEFIVDGSRTGIRATVTSVEGADLEYDPVVFIDGDSVAETVERQLRTQGIRAARVECGELAGERDATGECTVTERNGSEVELAMTVTEVDGLQVGFEFAPK